MSHSPFSPLHCSAGSLLESLRILPSTDYKIKINSNQDTKHLVEDAKTEFGRIDDLFIKKTITVGQILTALLDNTMDGSGQRYIACVILATQGDKQLLQDVTLAWLEHLLYPFKAAAKQRIKDSSEPVVFSPTNPEIAALGQSSLLTMIRLRENNRCPITGFAPTDTNSSQFYPSRIFPCVWRREGTQKLRRPAVTKDMVNNWCSLDLQHLEKDIDSPCNTIFLHEDAHSLFQKFELWFEPTGVENEYIICSTGDDTFRGKKVAFWDHSESFLSPPNAGYLAMHAAFAKTFHQSGVGEYFNSSWSDTDEAGVLCPDGSSDVGFLLSSLVLGGR